jgi:hypothetical protein
MYNASLQPTFDCWLLMIAEFYLVDRGLRHRLPGFSSMGRLVIFSRQGVVAPAAGNLEF